MNMPISPPRRRLYLMRHGSVDYFEPSGKPISPDPVPLNAAGRSQADAAGHLFAQAGVRFDRVVVSGLPRTVETAQRVISAMGQDATTTVDHEPALREIRSGRLSDISPQDLEDAFSGVFQQGDVMEARRFLAGESIGELLDRALPAFDAWRQRTDWQCMLMVLHGGVNRALLASSMAGKRAFFGALEQTPACINVLDVASDHVIVRGVNLAPTGWLQHDQRRTTMEELLAQFMGLDPAPLNAAR